MNLHTFVTKATRRLTDANISTARLDCLVLAQHVLGKNKAWILAHPDYEPSEEQMRALHAFIKRRSKRHPVAYLTGNQEFYGRSFAVTPDVLIPRPETEALIEAAKNAQPKTVLDVGTGSGAIAVTLALETTAQVTATDVSPTALQVAKNNALHLNANVVFKQSNLLKDITGRFDVIAANLPYVDRRWQRSPETAFEPRLALFAEDSGLRLITRLITQAQNHLALNGRLILEADPRQHQAIIDIAQNFTTKNHDFVVELQSKPRFLAGPAL